MDRAAEASFEPAPGAGSADRVTTQGPPPHVLVAFAVDPAAVPTLLPGGQGTTWLAGDCVLKPIGAQSWAEEEADWLGSLLDGLPEVGFRVSRPARPVIPVGGHGVIGAPTAWTLDGWSAGRRLHGMPATAGRWADVLSAGRAFHAALAGVPRPDYLDRRTDPWSQGDRAAWSDDVPRAAHGELQQVLDEVGALRSPTTERAHLVHGDLTTNVLLASGREPAIIDLSLYWRPAGFAEAVVVADAIAWHGASREVVDLLSRDVDRASLVARALIFRLVTSDLVAPDLGARGAAYLQDNVAAARRVVRVLRVLDDDS